MLFWVDRFMCRANPTPPTTSWRSISSRGLRRPNIPAAVMIGQVPEVAGTRGCDAGFDRRRGLLPRLDALEEILHMSDRAVAKALFRQHWVLRTFPALPDALAIKPKAATIDLQSRLRSAELEAAIIDRRIHHAFIHHIKTGIAEGRLNRVGTFPLLENVFVRQHLRLARLVNFHGPVHNVDPVGE